MNPSNGQVAFATNEGELQIRESITNLDSRVHSNRLSKQWIEVVKYSPDGSKLAVGSHDNKIYILDANSFQVLATCQKHNSFITALDWSQDGSAI